MPKTACKGVEPAAIAGAKTRFKRMTSKEEPALADTWRFSVAPMMDDADSNGNDV